MQTVFHLKKNIKKESRKLERVSAVPIELIAYGATLKIKNWRLRNVCFDAFYYFCVSRVSRLPQLFLRTAAAATCLPLL